MEIIVKFVIKHFWMNVWASVAFSVVFFLEKNLYPIDDMCFAQNIAKKVVKR